MLRPSPLHERTSQLCRSFLWKEWNGYAAVRAYDAHSEAEYFSIRNRVGMIDVSPLVKADITGPDAGVLLSRVFSRDIESLPQNRVAYGLLVDPYGKVLDDGTCAHIDREHFRLCTSDRWVSWLRRFSRGLRVQLQDTTEDIAAVAVQGPLARDLLAPVMDFDVARMPFFRVRNARIGGLQGQISRTGYTGDLGYELWVDKGDALKLWDLLSELGKPLKLEPFGLDALDVVRIEAGFILPGVDFYSSKTALTESRKSSPHELGPAISLCWRRM